MSSTRLWRLRIRHMLEAIADRQRYVQGLTQEQLGAGPRTLHAVAWCLTILGEAARHTDPTLRHQRDQVTDGLEHILVVVDQ